MLFSFQFPGKGVIAGKLRFSSHLVFSVVSGIHQCDYFRLAGPGDITCSFALKHHNTFTFATYNQDTSLGFPEQIQQVRHLGKMEKGVLYYSATGHYAQLDVFHTYMVLPNSARHRPLVKNCI